MPTITGQQIADRAWTKVNEPTGSSATRWTPTEALLWINDGQREVVNQLPKSHTKAIIAPVVAGTRQTLAGLGITDGISVVDVTRNFDAAGTVPGRALTKRERVAFDEQNPSWHSATAAADAVHWIFDERDPKSIYIYPPKTPGTRLEVIYAAAPTDLANLSSTIALDDIYANALQFFMLFSFYSKDATYAKSPQMAASYWALFMQSLGFRDKSIMEIAMAGDAKSASLS
jgi:hypothetical protein